ncbi:MAG: hypothetical protein ACYC6Y_10290, partial [Thermoguttaceae bacterium]
MKFSTKIRDHREQAISARAVARSGWRPCRLVKAFVLLVAATALAAPRPMTLIRHGGLESQAGWSLGPARVVEEGCPGPCLRFDKEGGASQDVFVRDNWTLVAGSEARRLDDVAQPDARPAGMPPQAAILREAGMPAGGSASNPEVLALILRNGGVETTFVSADELADPTVFHAGRFDLVVLPTCETFPAVARRNFVEFLRQGGAFLSTGGYAFNELVRHAEGRWQLETDVVRRARDRAMSPEKSLHVDGGFERSGELPLGG